MLDLLRRHRVQPVVMLAVAPSEPARAQCRPCNRTKRISLWVMAARYAFAGFNHLANPAFYLAIIPPGASRTRSG